MRAPSGAELYGSADDIRNIFVIHETPLMAFFATLALALAALEVGYRSARRRASQEPHEGILGVALSAHLALLGFILAFTFGLASNRLGERKALVIREANAIGTAGLRASALPEPRATKLRELLTSYTELRAVLVPEGKVTFEEATERNDLLSSQIWSQARAAIEAGKPSAEFVTSFGESVNEVLDTGSERVTVVYRHHIPRLFWFVLGVIGATCMFVLGIYGGARKTRPWITLPLVVSFAVVVMLIVDLDSPSSWVHLNQQPMLDALRVLQGRAGR